MGGINNTMEKLKFMKDFKYQNLDDYKKSMETLGINKADFKNFILVILENTFILCETREVFSVQIRQNQKVTIKEISSSDWGKFKFLVRDYFYKGGLCIN